MPIPVPVAAPIDNLTSNGTTTYGYDAENRLISSSNGAGLTYDPSGRLWQVSGGAAGTTQFLYDGDQLTAEYDGGGNLLRRYVHGTGEDDPLLWYEGTGLGDRRSLQTDYQGSIVSVADASGNALALNSYDEYGAPARGNLGRFQYTGQAWLPNLKLYYYKARVYDPKSGRFLQTDPVGYDDQVNLYAYVANDPVNHTDPTGRQEEVERNRGLFEAETSEGNLREDEFRRANDVLTRINGGREAQYISAPDIPPAREAIISVYRSISQTLVSRAASENYNSEGLTRAGRSLSDHPGVIGRSPAEFQKEYRTVSQINEAGARAISSVVNNGRMSQFPTRSTGNIINFERGDGYQARFRVDEPNAGQFVGFADPKRERQ